MNKTLPLAIIIPLVSVLHASAGKIALSFLFAEKESIKPLAVSYTEGEEEKSATVYCDSFRRSEKLMLPAQSESVSITLNDTRTDIALPQNTTAILLLCYKQSRSWLTMILDDSTAGFPQESIRLVNLTTQSVQAKTGKGKSLITPGSHIKSNWENRKDEDKVLSLFVPAQNTQIVQAFEQQFHLEKTERLLLIIRSPVITRSHRLQVFKIKDSPDENDSKDE